MNLFLFFYFSSLQELQKQWRLQIAGLLKAFDHIVQSKNKQRKPPKNEVFYNSDKYLVLTKVVSKPNSCEQNDSEVELGISVIEQVNATLNVSMPSSSETSDIITTEQVNEIHNVPKKNVVKGHSDYCLSVCISCLDRSKSSSCRLLIPKSGANSLVEEFVKICPDFFEMIDYLPKVVCDCCRRKLENKSATILVDYAQLVENVKEAQMGPSTSTSKCSCEVCRIATTTINPQKSLFLLQSKPKPGRPSLKPVNSQSIDFSGLNQTEKVNQFLLLSPGTRDQMSAAHVEQKIKESDPTSKRVNLKRLHGQPMQLPKPGTEKPTKTVITKGTLIKIKKELYLSGRGSTKMAQILSADNKDGIKIEKHFKEHVIENNKKLKSFFSSEKVDMQIYEKVDFQLWKLSNNNTLINKSGHACFQDNIMILPDVAVTGIIEDANSGNVLTFNKTSNEVTLKPKVTLKKSISTRSNASDPRSAAILRTSEKQTWILSHADAQGWFYIKHKKSGNFLTSNKTNVTLEEHCDKNENTQKMPFNVKKDFAFCNDIEALITHIADERDYDTDQELKIEIGLDSGKGSCKVFMTVTEHKKIGAGDFGPLPKKPKREAKWKSKHLDRGVKKMFVLGLVRNISETYQNFKILLSLPGLQLFAFIFDFKATRISLGLQPCSSKYSCSYCIGKAPFLECAELRTFRSLKKDQEGFRAEVLRVGLTRALKNAQKFHNAIYESLIIGDFLDQKILFKVLIDELHVFLGIGNKTFDSMYAAMVHDIDNDIFHASVYVWAEEESICGQKYRGGQLGGFQLEFINYKL